MKTKLLFIACLCLSIAAYSQILDSQNFDDLTIGNFSEDESGATTGQGGFFIFGNNGAAPTTSDNYGPSNFQVVATGNNETQGAQITSPNGDKGIGYLFKSLESQWAAKDEANGIIEAQFSFFTGSTTSLAIFRAVIFSDQGIAAGLQYNPLDRSLSGVAALNVPGAPGTYTFRIGAGNTALILPENTWIKMGYSYDTASGLVRWKTDFNNISTGYYNEVNSIPAQIPAEVDFYNFGFAGNTVAATYVIDDFKVQATAEDDLLSVDDLTIQSINVSLFPNPVNDVLTLQTNSSVKEVTIFNTLGQDVFTNNSSFVGENDMDVSNLDTGMYIINITTNDGRTITKKFLKE
jgi:hypothetical protein